MDLQTNNAKSTGLQVMDFHGDAITTFEVNGEPHVAMRPIVENLGLAWQVQNRKIQSQAKKFNCNHMVSVGADGKQRSMLAIPTRKLTYWLATINPNKVKDDIKRQKIELYQEECAEALYNYWHKGVAVKGDMDGVVTDLDPRVMQALGGMFKGIVNKAIGDLVPSMVEARLAEHRFMLRKGQTAKQIWDSHNLPPKLRGSTAWLGNRLKEMGCSIENEGRADVSGTISVRLFDPDKARVCMKNGLKHKAAAYASERRSQTHLKLVHGGVK